MNPFRKAIHVFDHALQRPVLQSLNLGGMSAVMTELEHFHARARQESDPADRLVAVGCRLSSDLNEAISERLVDAVQEHDQAIEVLSAALKRHLREREQATRLLRKSNDLKQETLQTGENAGLGLVL